MLVEERTCTSFHGTWQECSAAISFRRKRLQFSSVRVRLFLAVVTLPGCWSGAPVPATTVQNTAPLARSAPLDLRVPLSAEVGTVDSSGTLHPTTEIPLYPGSEFGWRIELGCEHSVQVEEELELPSRGDWGTDSEVTVSKNGRVARIQSEAICLDGWIDNTWTVSPNDPAGRWKLTVTAAGYHPQVFYATFVTAIAPPMSPLPQPAPGPLPPPTP